MAPCAILITGGDAKYFPLAQGTVASIRDKPQSREVCLAFLDLGCTPEQLAWLEEHVDVIKTAHWEFSFAGREAIPQYLKGLFVRPFLQQYFPGFDVYVWIDGDAWVQDWSAIDLLVRGASRRGLAIVPEVDRGSHLQYGGLPAYWDLCYRQYESSFGKEVARELHSHALLNAGVFALAASAPHWDAWARQLFIGVRQGSNLYTDQCALNVIVYKHGLFDRTEMLPAWCNWPCHIGLPAWDKAERRLVEPYLPHTPLGIVHLTGDTKPDHMDVSTTDLDRARVSVRYNPPGEQAFCQGMVVRQEDAGLQSTAALPA